MSVSGFQGDTKVLQRGYVGRVPLGMLGNAIRYLGSIGCPRGMLRGRYPPICGGRAAHPQPVLSNIHLQDRDKEVKKERDTHTPQRVLS